MKTFFSSELSLKLFSLALGIAIFFAVRTEQQVTTTVGLRLVLQEPAHLINTADVPGEVTVRLTGSSSAIRSMAPEHLGPVVLDLSSFSAGTSTVRIREDALGLPPELGVVSISPSTLQLRLEEKVKRRLPVRVVLQGDPADGYVVQSSSVEPLFAEVEGPRHELEAVRVVRTAPVDITGARENVTASVVFEMPGPHVRIAEGAHRAEVHVRIDQERAERTVRLDVVGVPGARDAVQVRAKLRGPRTVVERLDEKSLNATAVVEDESSARPFPVKIENLPEGVEILEPLPTVRRPMPPVRRR